MASTSSAVVYDKLLAHPPSREEIDQAALQLNELRKSNENRRWKGETIPASVSGKQLSNRTSGLPLEVSVSSRAGRREMAETSSYAIDVQPAMTALEMFYSDPKVERATKAVARDQRVWDSVLGVKEVKELIMGCIVGSSHPRDEKEDDVDADDDDDNDETRDLLVKTKSEERNFMMRALEYLFASVKTIVSEGAAKAKNFLPNLMKLIMEAVTSMFNCMRDSLWKSVKGSMELPTRLLTAAEEFVIEKRMGVTLLASLVLQLITVVERMFKIPEMAC